MKQPLKPNYLAKTMDHQKSAAQSIPRHLTNTCIELGNLTTEIKNLLRNCLPREIIQTLWVGKYLEGRLTLSVSSHTAANHLRYQANNLITILKNQSITFNQLKNIHVIVTFISTIEQGASQSQQAFQSIPTSTKHQTEPKSHNTYGLSQSTRRTIAHTARHVINDARLKRCLEKLSKS